MNIISRSEAKALNLKHYFTGKECINKHVSFRFVSDGKCNDCASMRNKQCHLKHRDERIAKMKLYAASNAEKGIENSRRFRKKQQETNPNWNVKRSAQQRKYRMNDPLHLEKSRVYANKRYANCVEYRISCSIRQYVHRVLKMSGAVKTSKTFEIIGYTPSELKLHLESLFTEGMSWDNHGEWHIDHVIPLSVMVEYGITEPHLINSLDNLQPMWAYDNRSKGNRSVG